MTVDDLPVALIERHTMEEQVAITSRLLMTLERHEVPAVGFVNESKLMVDGKLHPGRLGLLEKWIAAGQVLGNHGYAHLDLHRVETDAWLADVLRGEVNIRPLIEKNGGELRWFRHPFLHTGRSAEVQHRTAAFLEDHGYQIAPVTIDNGEWIYGRAYAAAWNRRAGKEMERIGEDYVRYMLEVVDYYENQSREIAGELIPQVLLVHAYALNADWLDTLLEALEKRGYEWIRLEDAVSHPVYERATEGYTGSGGITWLHRWAITAGMDRQIFRGEPEVPGWVEEIR